MMVGGHSKGEHVLHEFESVRTGAASVEYEIYCSDRRVIVHIVLIVHIVHRAFLNIL